MILASLGNWLWSFLLTEALEVGIYLRVLPATRPRRERLALALAASAITHPLVNFVIYAAVPELVHTESPARDALLALGVAECFAWLVEALWLIAFDCRAKAALLASLAANALSFTGVWLVAELARA